MIEPVISLFDIRTRDISSRHHSPTSDNNLKPKLKIQRIDFTNPEISNNKIEITNVQESPAQHPKEVLGILHPNSFHGLKVNIRIQDIAVKQQVSSCLSTIGAVLCPDTFPAIDAVVSEKPIRLISPQLNSFGRSRGNLLAAQSTKMPLKSPQVILLAQIPWALVSKQYIDPVKGQAVVEIQESAEQFVGIVVADEKSAYKPFFKPTTKMPQLYACEVPRGYYFTPFTQPPKDPTQLLQKYANLSKQKIEGLCVQTGPSDDGYCELCNISFKNAEAHRCSAEHQRNAQNDKKWADFDALCESLAH